MKKNLKRFLSMALAIVMVFGLLPTIALAADETTETVRYEMEDGVLTGANVVVVEEAGNSGDKRVGSLAAGETVSFTVEAIADCTSVITVCYGQDAERPLEITVNGTTYNVACGSTGSWVGCTGTVAQEVELVQGENTIVFGRSDDWAPNLDYFEIVLPTLEPDPETVTLEAENAVLANDARPSSANPGVIGWIGDATEGTVTFNFDRNYAGTVVMNIYHAMGDDERTIAYTVNGGEMVVIPATQTGGWGTPTTEPLVVEIDLVAGANTIVFSGAGNGAKAANLDKIELIKVGPKAALTAENVSAEEDAGEIRVPVTLTNGTVLKSDEGVNGDLAGLQFNVSYDAEGVKLIGFEPAEAFDGFAWGTQDHDTYGIVIGYSDEIVDNTLVGVEIANTMVIGELVFAVTNGSSVNVELAVEAACDSASAEYTTFMTSSFLIEVGGAAPVEPIQLIVPEDTVALAAGAAQPCYAYRVTGMIMTVEGDVTVEHNGQTFTAENGVVTVPVTQGDFFNPSEFIITNNAGEAVSCDVTFSYAVGHSENPAELVIGENTAPIEAGDQDGYWYTWVAEETGHLTLDISTDAAGWTYVVNNMTTFAYGDTQWSDSDPVVNPAVIDVTEGDTLSIMVSTYDPENPWSAPAGEVVIDAAFEACVILPFEDLDLVNGAWYHAPLDYMVSNGYINGTSETTMSPNQPLVRAQLVAILYRMAGSPSVEGMDEPFTDVDPEVDSWYYDAVVWAYNNKVVTGTSETTFEGGKAVAREQIATILYRYYGEPAVEGDLSDYKDAAKVNGYAVNAMIWATQNGLINGVGENMLNPLGNANRAQAATILYRYANLAK